ncbi:MAG TPA: TIGR02281 family clan AA aspartic protease [Ectothiorhodospiraceae bacterium]|nr:TIGR02281 family clan AA aspartic protease [Ectothiorhodospiraceae bacterium]
MKPLLTLMLALLYSFPLYAVESITVQGLFSGKVLIEIDGKSRLMREGERSAEGVLLIYADSHYAEIELEGVRQKLTMGATISSQFAAASRQEVTIPRGADGMYRIGGAINGRGVEFMVDTGATSLAMNSQLAKRLGIDYRKKGRKGLTETASAVVVVYQVNLDKVEVGSISLHNVEAVVLEGAQPSVVLLGLSFLKRIELTQAGNILKLRK